MHQEYLEPNLLTYRMMTSLTIYIQVFRAKVADQLITFYIYQMLILIEDMLQEREQTVVIYYAVERLQVMEVLLLMLKEIRIVILLPKPL